MATPYSTKVRCRIDEILEDRGMTLTELSKQVSVTVANLSVIKNNRARAIRFTTLAALCEALDCTIGELFVYDPDAPGIE